MRRNILVFLVLLLILIPVGITLAKSNQPTGFTEIHSYAQLLQDYAVATPQQPIRILIVPGHEPGYGGAEYQGVYERELTVEIADQLAAYLRQNPKLQVIVARSTTAWNPDIGDYFDSQWRSIQKFVTTQKKGMAKLTKKGTIETRSSDEQVDHAKAPDDVALRLYGIGKWANENDIDVVVHLHINDTPDHGPNDPSPNSGFAVYVPDAQYGNAAASRPLGEAIARYLSAMNATSSLPIENQGVVEDQDLIALGANGTLFIPSVLIEYSYITESKLTHPEVRSVVTNDFAYDTYLGIQSYLQNPVVAHYPTTSLPHVFMDTPEAKSSSPDAYALQAALHIAGFYPVATTTPAHAGQPATTTPRTLADCPISGLMGPCTIDGIRAFQVAHGWKPTGSLGPLTRAALNAQFATGVAQ